MRTKSFSYEMDTDGLPINEVARLHNTFFETKKYEWWYDVLPGDTVIEIGAGNFLALISRLPELPMIAGTTTPAFTLFKFKARLLKGLSFNLTSGFKIQK